MLNPARLNLIGYGGEAFGTPLSAATLDRVLDVAELNAGDSVLDVGCGGGQMALHYAHRGLKVEAVERHAAVAEAAQSRCGGMVTVHTGEAGPLLAPAGRWRLVSAVGAGRLADGPQAVLTALAHAATLGGWVLWGETFWRAEPSSRLRAVAEINGRYEGHAAYVRAGQAAGLVPAAALESSRAEWDDYVFRYAFALDRHAAEHPDDAEAAAMAAFGRAWRDLYLDEAREVMGFGLYLFKKPA